MELELVLVGDELLEEWRGVQPPYIQEMLRSIGEDLAASGATLGGLHAVGDEPGKLAALLRCAAGRGADIVVTFGGLGPTHDDRVREEAAAVIGQGPPAPHPEAMAWLRQAYASRGIQMPERGGGWERMGHCPPGARPLRNPRGMACGLAFRIDPGMEVRCLPGVTIEALPMWREHVAIELRGASPATGDGRAELVVRGLREGVVGPVVEELLDERPDLRAGVYLVDLEGLRFKGIRVVLRGPEGELDDAIGALTDALEAIPGAEVERPSGGGGDA